MEKLESVDLSKLMLAISPSGSVTSHKITSSAPTQVNGYNVGLVTMETSPPHNGERHNDGDEIIILISGSISIESDLNPNQLLTITPGEACVIGKGEWHKIKVIEKAQLVFITPGENNEYRF